MPDRLKTPSMRVVGARQTLRALKAGRIECVLIASDASPALRRELTEAAGEAQAVIDGGHTMGDIGRLCRVNVPSSAAGILKNT